MSVLNSLGQYDRAKGIINELVSKYLKKDENIKVNAEDILITVGTQEALSIAVITLCDKENDVIIVEDPTYIGLTHLSIILGYNVEPVPVNTDGICLKILEEKIIQNSKKGKKVKLVYVIPDYQNPTGNSMPTENRIQLLKLADKYDFFILEDNAYGEFIYKGAKHLSLKALDVNKKVIYMRSFSKTLYPSLRIGVMAVNQLINLEGKKIALSDLMAKTKGYLTVNTSSINQAILGGILIKNNFSLKHFNKEKIASMKKKRNKLLAYLDKFLSIQNAPWAKNISWNIPLGGFFITIQVPFNVTKEEVIFCAETYKVIFTPMAFFYFKGGGDNQIRIAFTNLSEPEIVTAIERLAMYLKSKLTTN